MKRQTPLGNAWKAITMDDFDQFRCNLKNVHKFESLSSFPPLYVIYVHDEPNLLDSSDFFNEIDVFDVTVADDASYAIDVSDVLDESDIFTVADDFDITDIIETTDIDSVIDVTKAPDVKIVVVDVTEITNVINVSDDSYDLSSSSDIPLVTATREVLKVHHQVDI
jgi:hypothetical protein